MEQGLASSIGYVYGLKGPQIWDDWAVVVGRWSLLLGY